ncbi:flagellar motor protein MotB [Caenispirillum bisanense]|uniref:Chemotaxis protein MotB n=1 Tax=Caenispirillum bisanense TaxID=414052 RepID=A0A286GX66_9PROT|nr:flagellar motor protein MotB [Caenispirillum bisanense]SOE00135.1 chemotaxis protein MotB [Caenispirillum bisanense]
MDERTDLHESGTAAWMITFADLVVLMLTFFVLLFSMTTMKTDTWQAVSRALSRTVQTDATQPVNDRSMEHSIVARDVPFAMNLTYLAAVLEETLAADPVLGRARIAVDGDRLLLALPGDALFGQGAAFSPAGQASLASLAGKLTTLTNAVAVAGHAAPGEAKGGAGGFASPWELSLARAAAVANGLVQGGYGGPITVLGHGDSRSADLPATLSPAERASLARRVDVVIYEGARSR